MKTIAFHSYKGGTGRTMAVANFAHALSKAGQSVLVVDLDFDAPGLPSKFSVEDKVTKGYVDYLIETPSSRRTSEKSRMWRLSKLNKSGVCVPAEKGSITLLPAGNTRENDYYSKAMSLELYNRFDISNSEATTTNFDDASIGQKNWKAFKQDLEDFQEAFDYPDFCLVDCRAANNTSSVAIFGWADDIVEFLPCNREGVFGCLLLSQTLHSFDNLEKDPNIIPVVSRIPLDLAEREIKTKIQKICKSYNNVFDSKDFKIFENLAFVHEQRVFETGDNLVFKLENKSEFSLSYDYAVLLDVLAGIDVETKKQWEIMLGLSRGEELFEKTFKYMHSEGVLFNTDNQENVALRRETLRTMIESITKDQLNALEKVETFDLDPHELVSFAFRASGRHAGIAFGLEAQQPGKVWKNGVPKTAMKRLVDWCQFDREVGFGDWVPEFDPISNSGSIRISNHFLADTKMGDSFIMGYVEGVLMYLIDDDFDIANVEVSAGVELPEVELNLNFERKLI